MGSTYWVIFRGIVFCFAILMVANVLGARPYLRDYRDWADLIAPYAPIIAAITVFRFAVLRDRCRSRRKMGIFSHPFKRVAGVGAGFIGDRSSTRDGVYCTRCTMKLSRSESLSAAGLRAFFRIAEIWRLSCAEQQSLLGGVAKQTMFDWKARPEAATLSVDQLDRISYILGIYNTLHNLFSRSDQADAWLRQVNSAPPFGGKPASDLLLSGHMEDLILVRRYLDGGYGVW